MWVQAKDNNEHTNNTNLRKPKARYFHKYNKHKQINSKHDNSSYIQNKEVLMSTYFSA